MALKSVSLTLLIPHCLWLLSDCYFCLEAKSLHVIFSKARLVSILGKGLELTVIFLHSWRQAYVRYYVIIVDMSPRLSSGFHEWVYFLIFLILFERILIESKFSRLLHRAIIIWLFKLALANRIVFWVRYMRLQVKVWDRAVFGHSCLYIVALLLNTLFFDETVVLVRW